MSTNAPEVTAKPETRPAAAPPVPKRITNAQTVCNERNEKNKLCNGHLKQLKTAGEPAEVHLRGDDVLFKCQICGTLYMGPPLGHVRDPEKQRRFVEAELAALLQAAGLLQTSASSTLARPPQTLTRRTTSDDVALASNRGPTISRTSCGCCPTAGSGTTC